LSSYRQWDLEWQAALELEMQLGLETVRSGETLEGAQRFSDGAGRHGRF
jgi:enoyl-CoA hydratase